MSPVERDVRDVLAELEAQGADLHALRANLALAPWQRIAELVAMNRFHADVQQRTVSPTVRAGILAREVDEARRRLAGSGA